MCPLYFHPHNAYCCVVKTDQFLKGHRRKKTSLDLITTIFSWYDLRKRHLQRLPQTVTKWFAPATLDVASYDIELKMEIKLWKLCNISMLTRAADRSGLRHELSSPAPRLRSWVRIPLRHGCLCVFCVRLFCFYIVSSEAASRPNKRLMRTYHWISLFMSYIAN
jgi:hypothetical protein